MCSSLEDIEQSDRMIEAATIKNIVELLDFCDVRDDVLSSLLFSGNGLLIGCFHHFLIMLISRSSPLSIFISCTSGRFFHRHFQKNNALYMIRSSESNQD